MIRVRMGSVNYHVTLEAVHLVNLQSKRIVNVEKIPFISNASSRKSIFLNARVNVKRNWVVRYTNAWINVTKETANRVIK